MLYFSEIVGKKVYTEDNIHIGYLEDFIFLAAENPIVTKIVIMDKKTPNILLGPDKIEGDFWLYKV